MNDRELPLVSRDALDAEWCVGTTTFRVTDDGDYWVIEPKDLSGNELPLQSPLQPLWNVVQSDLDGRGALFHAPWGFRVSVSDEVIDRARELSASGRTQERMREIGCIRS